MHFWPELSDSESSVSQSMGGVTVTVTVTMFWIPSSTRHVTIQVKSPGMGHQEKMSSDTKELRCL